MRERSVAAGQLTIVRPSKDPYIYNLKVLICPAHVTEAHTSFVTGDCS